MIENFYSTLFLFHPKPPFSNVWKTESSNTRIRDNSPTQWCPSVRGKNPCRTDIFLFQVTEIFWSPNKMTNFGHRDLSLGLEYTGPVPPSASRKECGNRDPRHLDLHTLHSRPGMGTLNVCLPPYSVLHLFTLIRLLPFLLFTLFIYFSELFIRRQKEKRPSPICLNHR